MSEATNKQLTAIGIWTLRGLIGVVGVLLAVIFNDMRLATAESFDQIHKSVEATNAVVGEMSKVVIRLDEKVDRNREDIKDLRDDVDELQSN